MYIKLSMQRQSYSQCFGFYCPSDNMTMFERNVSKNPPCAKWKKTLFPLHYIGCIGEEVQLKCNVSVKLKVCVLDFTFSISRKISQFLPKKKIMALIHSCF